MGIRLSVEGQMEGEANQKRREVCVCFGGRREGFDGEKVLRNLIISVECGSFTLL